MGVIWFLSSRHHLSTDLGWVDTVLRKGAHMTEYAVLTGLWTWALLRRPLPPAAGDEVPGRHAVVVATVIAVAWAATDELHQSTVTGRFGTPWDVAIDAAGVGIAALVWRAWTVHRTRRAAASGRPVPRGS
jgi:VanZ family protein